MAQIEIITATVDSLDTKSKDGSIWVKMAEMDGGLYPYPVEPIWPPGAGIWFPDPGDTVEVLVPAGEDVIELGHDVRYMGKRFDPEHPVPSEFKTNYGKRRGFKTLAGHLLIFDDKAGTITIKNGKTSILLEMDTLLHLGGSPGTDFILKGTTFNLDQATLWPLISTYIGLIGAAFQAMGADPAVLPNSTPHTDISNNPTARMVEIFQACYNLFLY